MKYYPISRLLFLTNNVTLILVESNYSVSLSVSVELAVNYLVSVLVGYWFH